MAASVASIAAGCQLGTVTDSSRSFPKYSAYSSSFVRFGANLSKRVQTSSRGRVDSLGLSKHQRTFNIQCQATSTISEVERDVADVKKAPMLPFRVGHGFDINRLEPGLPLIIGGVNIPHDRGCEAHSDGNMLNFVTSSMPPFSSS